MLLYFASKPAPFLLTAPPTPAGSRGLCRAGSGFTLDAAVPQDGWDTSPVSGATPARGERSWRMISLAIPVLSRSKPAPGGQRSPRSPPGAAQTPGHPVPAASPSTGSLIPAILGQQSFPSLALAGVLQSHCAAYPFLKSAPHKYFVKHLLANVLFFDYFSPSLVAWKGCSRSHASPVCGSCRYLVLLCCFEVARALPSSRAPCRAVRCPHGGSQRGTTAPPFTPSTLPSTPQRLSVPPPAPLSAEGSPGGSSGPSPSSPLGPPSLLSILGTFRTRKALSHLHICLQLCCFPVDFHVRFEKQASGGAGDADNPATTHQG